MTAYHNSKALLALTKKNFWQYRNYFIGIPVGWFCFISLSLVLGYFGIIGDGIIFDEQEVPWEKVKVAFLSGTLMPIYIALVFVMGSCSLSCLYEERKEKSILFYKSMPASNGDEVLSKFFTICLLGPVLSITLTIIAFGILILIVMLLENIVFDLSEIAEVMISSFLFFLIYLVWALPIFAWALFISAISPRSPFVFFVLPVIFIVIAEKILFNSNEFLHFISDYAGNGANNISRDLYGSYNLFSVLTEKGSENFDIKRIITILLSSFQTFKLWMGFIMTTLFIIAAALARRRAY